MLSSRLAIPLISLLLCWPSAAQARRYPITKRDASGTWVGTAKGLLHGRGELWSRYGKRKGLPADRVNDVALSTRSVWVATDRGLARMDKGTRRWETFSTPDLPAARVTGVSLDSSDPDQVWVATPAGVAHYNVRTNRWTRHSVGSGLPSARVNDVLFRGRTVWAATDAGLAALDLRQGTWAVYTARHGLAGTRVLEIDALGRDLWLTCDQGLSRMNLQRRTFSPFRRGEGLPGARILSQARMQGLIYFITDKGLITYDTAADALAPFLHAAGLRSVAPRSVATAGGFVWFASAKGLMRFEPTRKSWEYYSVEDGLSADDLVQITVSGSLLLIFGAGGELDTYDYKKDEWVERSEVLVPVAAPAAQPAPGTQPAADPAAAAGQGAAPAPFEWSLSTELDTELNQVLSWDEGQQPDDAWLFSRKGPWVVNTLRLGAGMRWGSGRSLDLSGNLDWGDISGLLDGDTDAVASVQRYDLRLRYLGAREDRLREVILSDELRLAPEGGVLTEQTEVEGGRVVVDLGPRRKSGRFARLHAAAGLRRGTPARAVFRRPTLDSLQIKRFKLLKGNPADPKVARFVIPSSVRATLDGRELERNVDYFVDHDNGVLWFRNTDLVHALRVLEVAFEYEQLPRKSLGVVSMTDLLPRDGDIGQIKRAGSARWAKDEQGLFDEIDGGAEQYINRGWAQTLSQDFEWGSAGITLRIHDMADEKQAKSIFLTRKLPDAKAVPGLPDVFIEKQAASISIKLVRGRYFIEITVDQPTLEQEIQSIAGWLAGKLASSGGSAADALRDVVFTTGATLRYSERGWLGLDYIGTRAAPNSDLPGALDASSDLFSAHGVYSRRLGRATISSQLQAAASRSHESRSGRSSGAGVSGGVLLTSPWITARADARKYTRDFLGLGTARQTEFCRHDSGACALPGTSRLDHELGLSARIKALSWLPVDLRYQRQNTALGLDYDDAPAGRDRVGIRDVALASVGLQRQGLPQLTLGGGLVRREDPLDLQTQARASAALEADLADGLLRSLSFKKLYLRGLYELGLNAVDEHRTRAGDELDRDETMHHAVAELRVAPTLTESGYATLEYHGLQGVLVQGASQRQVADRLTYWRVDGGAGSSIVPGLAARFDATVWFGDDQPLTDRRLRATSQSAAPVVVKRTQEADSRLGGVMDIFPGEWVGKLSGLKCNVAYTYTQSSSSRAQRVGYAPPGKERCDVLGDEDGDGLADCADPDCAMDDACLQLQGDSLSHRVYGTINWDTPGKLQAELFGDARWSISGADQVLRVARQELRSYVTWRPIYPSPLTLRFDLTREQKRPQAYDGLTPQVEATSVNYEPALEWRRRWSPRWWHLAKLSLSYNQLRDVPHIRNVEDAFGRKGDIERQDYDSVTVTPSVELRRRFDDVAGLGSFRPYARASYKLQWGKGLRSSIDNKTCTSGDTCLADGSETSRTLSFSLGLIWILADKIFLDLDLNTSWYDCDRAANSGQCTDRVSFTPHLLTTMRY